MGVLVRRFRVGPGLARDRRKWYRETGGIKPKAYKRGVKPKIRGAREEALRQWLQEAPDLTLAELGARYQKAFGVNMSASAMDRTLKRLALTRKKKLSQAPDGKTSEPKEGEPHIEKGSPAIAPTDGSIASHGQTLSVDSSGAKSSPVPVAGPVDIRSAALAMLALFATLLMLQWAQAVLVPIVLSILISYSLDPLVSALKRLRTPRWLGALLLVTLFIGFVGYGSYILRPQAKALLDKIPQAAQILRSSFRTGSSTPRQGEKVVEKVQEAAKAVEKATKPIEDSKGSADSEVTKVKIVEPGFELGEYIWWGSLGLLAFLGQLVIVIILVLLFLISGDTYKRKLVKITGSTLSEKKITVEILDDINIQIRRHLFVLFISGVFVGVATWAAFRWWFGLEQAALWGFIAGVANFVPYLGPLMVFVATSIVGLVQFGTLTMGLAVGAVSLLITGIQGYLLTPWLISRTSTVNAIVVFIGLLFWGWLWGPIGLIVATPLLIIIKVCCDHIENLTSVGELMGGRQNATSH